jgi:hypothetical protein
MLGWAAGASQWLPSLALADAAQSISAHTAACRIGNAARRLNISFFIGLIIY